MKKLMIAAAAAVCGSVFALESANVVGFTTVRIESQYQIIGVNFQSVNGGNLKLNDAIPYQEGMTKAAKYADADQIQIGDDSGNWVAYYLSNGFNAKGKAVEGLDGKWAASGEYTVADVEIAPGSAFWYIRNDASKPAFNINIAGNVTTLPAAQIEFASQYRIFANPYTVPLKLDDVFPYDETTMTAANKYTDADQIQIGDDKGNWVAYYLSNGFNAKGKAVDGLAGKWAASGEYTVSNAEIPVGKAAWYIRKDTTKPALTVNMVKPYEL